MEDPGAEESLVPNLLQHSGGLRLVREQMFQKDRKSMQAKTQLGSRTLGWEREQMGQMPSETQMARVRQGNWVRRELWKGVWAPISCRRVCGGVHGKGPGGGSQMGSLALSL